MVAAETLIRAPALAPQRLRLGGAVHGSESLAQAAGVAEPLMAAAAEPDFDPEALRRDVEARVRAELIAELRKETEAEREAARRRGFAEGQVEGRAAAAAAAQQQQQVEQTKIDAALAAVQQGFDAAMQAVSEQAADIAFAAVTQILGAKSVAPDFVVAQVENVVRRCAADQRLTVRLHPRDARVLREHLGADNAFTGRCIDVIDDPTLEAGGCVVDCAVGGLDASLSTQLRRLRELLDEGAAQGQVS